MRQQTSRREFGMAAAAAVAVTLVAAAGCSSTGSSGNPDSSSTGTPKQGGTLRVGLVGGSVKDSLDAGTPITHPDEARVIALYDTLTTYDTQHKLQMALADKITPSENGKLWTVQLRNGLKFSDGSPITAADVVFTFQRITDPKAPLAGATAFTTLDRNGLMATGDRTVSFPFKEPYATFPDTIAQYGNGIVPKGYNPKQPVGSGPFKFQSITPGQESTFVKNPYYWRKGQPYLDKLVIIDFPDDNARVNALLSGQVDAIDQLPLSQINIVKANPQLKVLESQTGSWQPFTMRVDQPPFNDVRVRQAFRLMVDRQQMVIQVLNGHGTVGNDMYAPLDECYPKDIPQRTQNIAEAKKLLAAAGQSNLTVTLDTSPVAAGVVEAAQVFAQQAKAAGVTINVRKVDPGTFYGDNYLKWTFAQDFYFTRDYLPQAALLGFPTSPYNETHWNDAEWQQVVTKANATLDEAARCKLVAQAEKIDYDRGAYIVWGFSNNLDAYSSSVVGFLPDTSGIPLTSYGFRGVWLNK